MRGYQPGLWAAVKHAALVGSFLLDGPEDGAAVFAARVAGVWVTGATAGRIVLKVKKAQSAMVLDGHIPQLDVQLKENMKINKTHPDKL